MGALLGFKFECLNPKHNVGGVKAKARKRERGE
jgi:hypothetical protein